MPHDTNLTLVEWENGWWIREGLRENDTGLIGECWQHDNYRLEFIPPLRTDEVIVDVGACMGAFTRKAHERNPSARILAIEAHPDNMACLAKNAGAFATLLNVALTYEGAVGMTDSIHADNPLSGGNTVLPIAEILADTNPAYERFTTPLPTITLEDLIVQHNIDYIDVMKMDCEGSEYSILGKTPSLDKIGIIIGEYHYGINRFKQLVADRFPLRDWWHYMWNPSPQHYENIGYFWLARRSPPPYAS